MAGYQIHLALAGPPGAVEERNSDAERLRIMAPLTPSASYYAVLNLPQSSAVLRKSDVKLAYHRALLKHHPDKSGTSTPTTTTSQEPLHNPPILAPGPPGGRIFTVDQITVAYKVLSDPVARAEYDRSLRLSAPHAGGLQSEEETLSFRTGLEIFDLDDMEVETSQQQGHHGIEIAETTIWYRGCRCGDEKGFLVREEDLEREAERGEVMVGCRGCSLWAKVLFAVDESVAQVEANG